jgi:hypothetical protein
MLILNENDNPWWDYRAVNRYHHWFQNDPPLSNMAKTPCQAVVVDWILTFAFPYIKHISTIKLTSAIKTVQRNNGNTSTRASTTSGIRSIARMGSTTKPRCRRSRSVNLYLRKSTNL